MGCVIMFELDAKEALNWTKVLDSESLHDAFLDMLKECCGVGGTHSIVNMPANDAVDVTGRASLVINEDSVVNDTVGEVQLNHDSTNLLIPFHG